MSRLFPRTGTGAVLWRGPGEIDFADRAGIALLYAISGAVMELLGPLMWAELIVLFIHAELLSKLHMLAIG